MTLRTRIRGLGSGAGWVSTLGFKEVSVAVAVGVVVVESACVALGVTVAAVGCTRSGEYAHLSMVVR